MYDIDGPSHELTVEEFERDVADDMVTDAYSNLDQSQTSDQDTYDVRNFGEKMVYRHIKGPSLNLTKASTVNSVQITLPSLGSVDCIRVIGNSVFGLVGDKYAVEFDIQRAITFKLKYGDPRTFVTRHNVDEGFILELDDEEDADLDQIELLTKLCDQNVGTDDLKWKIKTVAPAVDRWMKVDKIKFGRDRSGKGIYMSTPIEMIYLLGVLPRKPASRDKVES